MSEATTLDRATELAVELHSVAMQLDLDAIARGGVPGANEVTRLARRSAQILQQIKEAVGPEAAAQPAPPLPPKRPNPTRPRQLPEAAEPDEAEEGDEAEAAEGADDDSTGKMVRQPGKRPRPLRAAGHGDDAATDEELDEEAEADAEPPPMTAAEAAAARSRARKAAAAAAAANN